MPQAFPILMYHSVDENCATDYGRWTVSPACFTRQMAYLKSLNAVPLTVSDMVAHLSTNSLPPRAIAITFDDGLRDFAEFALPILREFDYPSTLFVATGYVGKTAKWLAPLGEGRREMLSWAELEQLGGSKVELGAHTHTHPQLDLLPAATAEREILHSRALLRQHTGQEISTFAYPHGYSTKRVRGFVQRAGFTAACRVADALSVSGEDRFALSRIIVTEQTTDLDLARLLRGQNRRIGPPVESWKILAWRRYRHLAQMKSSIGGQLA